MDIRWLSSSIPIPLEYRLAIRYGAPDFVAIVEPICQLLCSQAPKEASAKSTAAVLLASELASHGGTVTMIDADPNRPLSQWATLPGKPEKLTVIDNATEDSIIDTIENAALHSTFVIVDLEGTASMMAGYAMSRADLVIIPAQGSHLDATEAVKAIVS